MKLSVVIATYNEAENIARCLDAVKGLAEEIIVVDGGSTDDTVKIAKGAGARIISTTNPPIFHINKQKGLDAAGGEWILQLDADEVVSRDLKEEISKVIFMNQQELRNRKFSDKKSQLFTRHQKQIEERDGHFYDQEKPIVGFFIPRANIFLGKTLRFGGVYPDGVIRLVRNKKAHFPCKSVHEQIQLDGNASWLESDLIHFDSPTFKKYLKRANRYTTLTSLEFKQKNIPQNISSGCTYLILKPIKTFFAMYFRHKGFLDGFPGFVFALFSGLHFTLAYMKYLRGK